MKSFVWGARGGLLLVLGAAGLMAASQAGCGLILGTSSFQDCCEGYGAAPPSGCVACSITGSGGAASGTGGFGAGMVCAPGAKRGCYSAKDQSTEGVGPCHAGNQFCNKEGTAWGACTAEVDPKPADDCSIVIGHGEA
jgi:hypothetical protein